MNGKDLGSTLLGGEKGKTIETDGFLIQGHLLRWEDVVIQIRNISMVSARAVPTPKFPIWALVTALVGFWLFSVNTTLALIVCFIGIGAIALWSARYNKVKEQSCLHILLNSGYTFSLIAQDVDFIKKILEVFTNIFKAAG